MALFFLIITLILTSCTTTKYIPIESVGVDSVFVAKEHRDSIYVRDSVFVAVKADTVFKTSLKYVYSSKIVVDTVYRERVDTIIKVKEVERQLSWVERLKTKWDNAVFLLAIMSIIFYFLKIK